MPRQRGQRSSARLVRHRWRPFTLTPETILEQRSRSPSNSITCDSRTRNHQITMTTSRWAELFNIWTWSKNILIISSSEFLFCESTRVTLNDSHASLYLSVSLWGNEKKNSLNGGSEPRSRDVKMVWDHVWGSHVKESPVMWCVRKVWQACVSYRSS